jgi:hypothetical protein
MCFPRPPCRASAPAVLTQFRAGCTPDLPLLVPAKRRLVNVHMSFQEALDNEKRREEIHSQFCCSHYPDAKG